MDELAPGNSVEQRAAEVVMLATLGEELGVRLAKKKMVDVEGAWTELDGVASDPPLSSRDGLVAIAVTDTPGMRRAVNEVEGSLRLLGVAVFLVSSDGSVIEQLPLADIATG